MSLSVESIEAEAIIREPGEKRIAIVGANNNFFKMGTIQCLNFINSGFSGDILPVHPKEKVILGEKACSFIQDLPFVPDLAVLVVPTGLVTEMLVSQRWQMPSL